MKYLKKTYLKEIEVSDLDLVNDDDVFGINHDGHDYNTIMNVNDDQFYWAREAQEIKIDTVIETLNKLKESGANYVEMLHHPDHHGYVFYGLEMEKASKEETAQYKLNEKKAKEVEKKKEIKELEKKLEKLKK